MIETKLAARSIYERPYIDVKSFDWIILLNTDWIILLDKVSCHVGYRVIIDFIVNVVHKIRDTPSRCVSLAHCAPFTMIRHNEFQYGTTAR